MNSQKDVEEPSFSNGYVKNASSNLESSDKKSMGHPSSYEKAIESRTDAEAEAEAEAKKRPETPQDTEEAVDVEALAHVESSEPIYSVFGKNQKRLIIFLAGLGAFYSPLAATVYFPALNDISTDLHITNEMAQLTLTTYMIFQGLAPTFMGDLADMMGRRPVYIVCFIIYIAANIGIALQNNYVALMILRCLQSTGSSPTLALAYGIAADVSTSSQRGTYMSLVNVGALGGPSLGPILGGALSQYLGWRSIFWFLTIMAGIYLVIAAIFFPETGRNVVGNGSIPPPTWNMSLLTWWKARRSRPTDRLQRTASRHSTRLARTELRKHRPFKWPNPLKAVSIIFEKDSGILLLYNSWVYTAFYMVITSIPQLFAQIYGLDTLKIGLCYIPFGAGCAVALYNGHLLDKNYKRIARRAGISVDKKREGNLRNFPIEKARLQVVFPLLYVGVVMLVLYGWMLQIEAHLSVPLILLFLIGFFVNGAFNAMSTMLIDLYPARPATATAANNLVRCWMGAGGTAVVILIVDALGRGWAFTLVGGLVFVASPMLWVLLKWGPKWREERRVREEKKRESRMSGNSLVEEHRVKEEKPEVGPPGDSGAGKELAGVDAMGENREKDELEGS